MARKGRAWVVVEGTFRNKPLGPFEQFFAQVDNVTEFQVLPGKPKEAVE